MEIDKLLPRNRTARLAAARAAGNPVTTELGSGVGNCFPGLEFDARNLDRRFFPYLVVDYVEGAIVVSGADVAPARSQRNDGRLDGTSPALIEGLEALANAPDADWRVTSIAGEFAGSG